MELRFSKAPHVCPDCASDAIRRSVRHGLIERVFMRLAMVWPYRCDDCDSRFWGFHRTAPAQATNRYFKTA